jgi:tetratricopeptide (TPR) repeat protein
MRADIFSKQWRRSGAMVVAALSFAVVSACDSTPKEARTAVNLYEVGDYSAAAAVIKPKTTKKDENFVLDNCRYGSAALAAGDIKGAENAFMAAYEVMNGVNTNNGGRTLGATLVYEGVKVWKGEPFERAMAHYYLGLIFLIEHDYENARAAFQNSLFKLNEYASKDDTDHYRASESSFALGYFGLGLCYSHLNKPDLAEENFKLAEKNDPRLAGVIRDLQQPGMNTVLFVDAGQGPRRAAKGWYNEESAFGPTPAEVGPVPPIEAFSDGQIVDHPDEQYNMVDTLAMAQQQRWQDIDTIRKTKAVIGTGAMAGGAGLAAYGADRGNTGLALAGLGVAAFGAALAASSKADVRYWEMLPRTVYVVPLALTPGTHQLVVRAGMSQSPPLTVTVPAASAGGAAEVNYYYFRLLR